MVCVLVLCWWGASLEAAPSPEKVLKKVEAFYGRLKALSGNFTQEVYWRRGLSVEASGGSFWFQKPDHLRWEYRYPEKILIVCDGKRVYFYAEVDRQVSIFPVKRAFSRPVLKFLSGSGKLEEDFEILSGELGPNGDYFLELRPREQTQISRLKLRVKVSTGEVREVWYWDLLGNLTHLLLEDLRKNPRLPPKLFTFTPPPGTEIISPTQPGPSRPQPAP
ncbi:MAG: hypothetical protein DSZ24_07015 [Thermodesulfatator sp.]|nr:MAG: hypothetical protein DSZ24_07015 [Thermodesulfatator sp.]